MVAFVTAATVAARQMGVWRPRVGLLGIQVTAWHYLVRRSGRPAVTFDEGVYVLRQAPVGVGVLAAVVTWAKPLATPDLSREERS
jgi:hypothetical protein